MKQGASRVLLLEKLNMDMSSETSADFRRRTSNTTDTSAARFNGNE
jgi:hypothetical protein